MLRVFGRRRRQWLVALYVALLGLWAALSYDTYGVWLSRHETIAHGLALAALGPTAAPESGADSSSTTATPEPVPTRAVRPTPTSPSLAVKHPKSGRYVAAWLPTSFDADRARTSFEQNKDLLDEVSPFWYTAAPQNGWLVAEPGARDRTLVDAAKEANVLVIPTIHNVYDPYAIIPLLRDPERRAGHIAAIMEEIRDYGFDGFDIDYELLPADVRPYYSEFMRELSTALHEEGKLLTVAVHAKSSDLGGLGGFQDWALLGQICDRVRIMTYDFHWQGSQPGPIAPLGWVSEVAEYAQAVIPPEKIQIGIPFYAYNWAAGEKAIPLTWADVQQLIDVYQPNVHIQERNISGPVEESWFTYRDRGKLRTVWFASSRALESKLDLVERENLGGIAIWRLGNEDPRNWTVIREQSAGNPWVIQRMIDSYLPDH